MYSLGLDAPLNSGGPTSRPIAQRTAPQVTRKEGLARASSPPRPKHRYWGGPVERCTGRNGAGYGFTGISYATFNGVTDQSTSRDRSSETGPRVNTCGVRWKYPPLTPFRVNSRAHAALPGVVTVALM